MSLGGMFLDSAGKYADREALKYKVGHHYHSLTYGDLKGESLRLAAAVCALGLKSGDRVMIISENRPEWVITDLAMMMLGIATVPIHEVLSPAQLADVISEVKPRAIFFSDHHVEAKLLEIAETVAKVPHLISYEDLDGEGMERISYFKDVIDGAKLTDAERKKLENDAREVDPDSLASIIYTSGTCGHFKGVMLSHKNFLENLSGVARNILAFPEDKFFSVLPLSHVFERTAGYYVPISSGASIGYSLDLTKISDEIKERKPTIILAVPRLYEKIYEKVLASVNKSLIKGIIFRAAFGYKPKGKDDKLEKLFEKLVFSKIKENFGGEIRFFVSGGAKLPERIGKFFDRMGLIILEGYGLTETAPVIACNKLDKYKFGTVGPVLENLQVRISNEEEILVKGPSVMSGYLRKEDNKDTFTKDGYFRTGDLGFIDHEGFLIISGRMKDLLVLTTGKKVAPVPIENALEMSPYIEQAFVFGDGYKHVGALIVPNLEAIGAKLEIKGKEKILKDPRTNELLAAGALAMTHKLSTIEHIKKFVVLGEPFSIENGELTPKLSLRRHIIVNRYKDLIEEVYK